MTEVWFRNPHNYIRELVETGKANIAWDRGMLSKRKIDPVKHAEIYFGKAYPWRSLAIGSQGAAEYRDGDSVFEPTAVYPVWQYGESQELLEEFFENPLGENVDLCNDDRIPGDERPVLGQEHRVVIVNLPILTAGPGRRFIAYLKELQEEYPEAIMHIHGLYSYRFAFGMGFGAADTDPRTLASKGKVTLPTGKEILREKITLTPQWPRILGIKAVDLEVGRNRCMFNIISAAWAGENFNTLGTPRSIAGPKTDSESPDEEFKPPMTKAVLTSKAKAVDGDKVSCNICTLSNDCKHFREGAVCSLPNAETQDLAKMFSSRDSGIIIDGLGALASANARRLQRGMKAEDQLGDIDPEVTRLVGQVFDQGSKLAKLIDPELRSGAKVQVNVGAVGSPISISTSPRAFVADAIRTLQAQGIERDKITPEMISGLMSGMNTPNAARTAAQNLVIEQ